MEARVYTQCTAANGQTGTFLALEDRVPLSPVCEDYYALWCWLKKNGWDAVPGTMAGRYRKD